MRETARYGFLLFCWMLAMTAAARAQPVPLGPEVPLDPQPGGDNCPLLAAHGDGTFAAGWESIHGNGSAVMLRTGDGAGGLGPARTLDTRTPGEAAIVGVAATAAGYEAVWLKPTAPGHLPHIVQQLDATGGPRGKPVVLARHNVDMSPRPAGGIVAVWSSNTQLNVQRLNGSGVPLGPPVKVRTTALYPQVVHRPSGEFVVVWETGSVSHGQFVEGGYLAQRFSATGAAVGKPFRVVPPPPAGGRPYAKAGLGADGTLAVMWSLELAGSIEDEQVTLRIFDVAGHPVGGPVPITTHDDAATANAYPRAVALDDAGRALVIWAWDEDAEEPHVRARVFARDGSPIGDFFDPVSDASRADFPAFLCGEAAWNGTDWVVTWSGWTSPINGPDTDSQIWVRRFAGD